MSLDLFETVFKETFVLADKKKRVGSYNLGRVIGRGAFGTVRLGTHLLSGEQAAVKVVPKKSILQKEKVRRRFWRELQALKRMDHPSIVCLKEWMETERNFYLVLTYINGETLRQYLNNVKRLSENEARRYVNQMTSAIHYMHKQNIMHRDIKLENAVLQSGGRVFIVDFGLSVDVSNLENPKLCGSPTYMAPEILIKQNVTVAADIWSLGICVCYLVTGSHPYQMSFRDNYSALYFKILQGSTLPSFLSEECKDLIRRMLSVDPVNRIPAEEILTHAWFARIIS
uniref:CBL-interacting protein kinase 31-like n=1 Tax=Crassostrea virginica TaxID=6565 RepID=A0A8B8ATJ0_CRAVI|nr:CBL-interacting protein kinase 31-like [Crassostrea virginica]